MNNNVINGTVAEAEVLLQRRAREEMKERLLQDILCDITVCGLMGTDKMEYINELKELVKNLGVENE